MGVEITSTATRPPASPWGGQDTDPAHNAGKPACGAHRAFHGELLMLGIGISQAAVSKYMIRHPKPPSQTWRTFLRNHVGCLASVDFFVVPTARFRLLFVFIVLRHERRHIVHFGVTATPHIALGLAADPESVSMGDRAAVSDPGSRWVLRCRLPLTASGHGNQRSSHRPQITLAERLRGTRHRNDPA